MYAIAGVTGNTGSAAAQALLDRGEKVRVIVRDEARGAPWKARGAEVAVADLADPDALARALTGVRGAYLLLPPDLGADDVIASRRVIAGAIEQALRRVQPARTVLLSSIGAQHAAGTGPIVTLHDLEQRTAGLPGITYLRAAFFLDNFAGVIPAAVSDGVLPTFAPPEVPMPTVATTDIGRVAAALLTQAEAPPRIVELAGPDELSAADVAAALGRILGRDVAPLHLPLDQVEPTFTSIGMGADMARLYRELYEAAGAGLLTWTGAELRRGTAELETELRRLGARA